MTDSVRAPEIVTRGTGHDERDADRAEVELSFVGRGPDRAAAVAELGRRVAAAEGALAAPGLTVRHRRLWVADDWHRRRVKGCSATEDIGVRLGELDRLDEVLAALVAAEPARLHGPRWSLAEPSALLREAQRRAVADARERAEGYAAALGGRLGGLLRLEDGDNVEHVYRAAAMEGAPQVPDVADLRLDPEPVRVTVHCTTTWSLLL
ncbi:MAG TPA: SIMPL domain-containing protein [Pseudonocardia sp.]|nr:SIMPL domain-containing protein [Pseudonocardia sp.]